MQKSNIDWDFIVGQIYRKKCTPIISNQVINSSLFGSNGVVQLWAEKIGYPLADRENLTRVAQFLSITGQDSTRAKSSYLEFLKRRLFEVASRAPDANQDFLEEVKSELRGFTFSVLATERLSYPDFKQARDNPLSILAMLDIPVYLTTSHHRFIEAALKAAGKSPRTEVYSWREDLEDNLPARYRTDLDFEPDVKTPLVFHLHGLDDYPDSLVFTEDDHLEFLVNVTQDFQKPDIIPSSVRNALSSSLLILLGYNLHAWDLRVLLQGLIKGKPRRPRSFAIQLRPNDDEAIRNSTQFEEYLRQYFGRARFDIYWGDSQGFMKTLWREWEEG